jgi:mono/diheme cytochrome c family protein
MRIGSMMLAAALMALPGVVAANEDGPLAPFDTYSGAQLYGRFCASCHGPAGQGDGPVGPTLKVVVPDLTRIAARNGGRFPEERIREIVDGRAVIPAHGTRYMPVWGYEFEAQVPDDQPGRAAAQTMIDRLVGYLESLQQS